MDFSKQLDLLHESFIDGVFAAAEEHYDERKLQDAQVYNVLCARGWSADTIDFWINNYHERKAKT